MLSLGGIPAVRLVGNDVWEENCSKVTVDNDG